MSIRVMAQVWATSKAKGSSLLLQLAIADHAADDGTNAYPAVETLSKKIRMGERQTQYMLRLLEQLGEIRTHQGGSGPKDTNYYTVTPGGKSMGAKIAPFGELRVQSSAPKGAVQRPLRVQPNAPETSLTVHNRANDEKAGRFRCSCGESLFEHSEHGSGRCTRSDCTCKAFRSAVSA